MRPGDPLAGASAAVAQEVGDVSVGVLEALTQDEGSHLRRSQLRHQEAEQTFVDQSALGAADRVVRLPQD